MYTIAVQTSMWHTDTEKHMHLTPHSATTHLRAQSRPLALNSTQCIRPLSEGPGPAASRAGAARGAQSVAAAMVAVGEAVRHVLTCNTLVAIRLQLDGKPGKNCAQYVPRAGRLQQPTMLHRPITKQLEKSQPTHSTNQKGMLRAGRAGVAACWQGRTSSSDGRADGCRDEDSASLCLSNSSQACKQRGMV